MRAALVLRGKVSHELSCGSCGAPIHNMKRLALDPAPAPRKRKEPKPAISHRAPPKSFQKPKKRKRRKSALRWFIEEAADVIEDIFD
jgi:hypothetical protein